jgi:hypothetical protein
MSMELMQRGLDVKRVEHAVAVETTTHPVAVCHVKNNMAPALFPPHCRAAVHELHGRLHERQHQERMAPAPVLKVSAPCAREREQCRDVSQKRTYGFQARISPA